MVSEQTLNEAVQRIVDVAKPRRVILFGSYARGDADADSDVDLMVIKRRVTNKAEDMIRLRRAVGSIGVGGWMSLSIRRARHVAAAKCRGR